MDRLSRVCRVLLCGEFVVAVAVIVYAGVHDVKDVFFGAPAAVAVQIDGSCEAGDPSVPCHVSVAELHAARYRIASDAPARTLTITLGFPAPMERAHHLLVRVSQPTNLELYVQAHDGEAFVEPAHLTNAPGRTVTPLPAAARITALSFVSEAEAFSEPIVLDELGFFEDNRGLLTDVRRIFQGIPPLTYHGTLVPRVVARLCIFSAIAAFFVPRRMLRKLLPVLLPAICFSLCVLDLAVLFSPYGSGDLRAFYAGGPLQNAAGSNLNGGLWQAERLLAGQGLTVGAGVVSWERMPGYGLFCAVAALFFGHSTLVDLATATVLLQVIFYCAAAGFFVWAAGQLWQSHVVWIVGLLIAMLPKQLGYTQVDSIIAPVTLLILAALCIRLKSIESGRPVGLAVDLFVHLTFALWFLMRPDVLPGWLVVSLVLYWRSPRLMIPIVLAVAIGVSWASYKMQYTREFVPTTANIGATLMCGLWEVPSRFASTCSDAAYFNWITKHTPFEPTSQAASNFATREVLKFWLTFPGHFVIMLYDKMLRFLGGDVWPGHATDLQQSLFQIVPRAPLVVFLLTTMALAVAAGHERLRTLLLAWPLFLNAPLFWVMQASDGRFYSAAGVALVVAAVPLLFERPFYVAIAAQPRRTVALVVSAGVLAMAARPLDVWLLHNDAFHYWTPFFNASSSPWGTGR